MYNIEPFKNLKQFTACKQCQYFVSENEDCKSNCIWKEVENIIKAYNLIKDKCIVSFAKRSTRDPDGCDRYTTDGYWSKEVNEEEYEFLKEMLKKFDFKWKDLNK